MKLNLIMMGLIQYFHLTGLYLADFSYDFAL